MTTAHEPQRIFALLAAVLFGPGTPFTKQLVSSLWRYGRSRRMVIGRLATVTGGVVLSWRHARLAWRWWAKAAVEHARRTLQTLIQIDDTPIAPGPVMVQRVLASSSMG